MNLSAIAIKRPVFTVMVIFALMVFGVVGFLRLGTDLFPAIDLPVVAVNVLYPGAAPNEVETHVSKPLEDAVISLNGIDRVQTYSREGLSTTIIFFKLGVDLQEAATEVRERVSQARGKLPDDVLEPTVNRFDVGAAPILTYTLSGGGPSLADTAKFARDVLRPALEQVDGVAAVDVRGGAEREVQVNLNLAKIDSLKLSAIGILTSLRAENLTVPAGHFDEGVREVAVRTVGEFKSTDEIRNVIVATASDGSSVRLGDVASVEDGYEELRTRIRTNGSPSVSFDVVKQSGKNTVAVANGIKAKLAEIYPTLPKGMEPLLIIDQSKFIEENTHEVEVAIVFGGAMAILVILLFMLDLRSTLISAVALPTSVISTFFVMYLLGFTLNMMTLLALSLAIGLLIDDAVVVRENISKHLERGEDPKTAALEGTKEISLSVLATTLTVVAVFVPVAFMTGMVGQFFKQFGLTIVGAVLMSLFVAFTLDPMLSSRFSKRHVPGQDRFAIIKAPFERVFSGIDSLYRSVLNWAVSHKLLVFVATALAFLSSIGFAALTGNEFVNQEDRGQFVVDLEFPAGTSLDESARLTAPLELQILKDPNFKTILSTIGPDGDSNKVKWRMVTTSKRERQQSLLDLKGQVRTLCQKSLSDMKVAISDPPFIEGAGTVAPIMIDIRGATYEELDPLSKQFEQALKAIPGVTDIQRRYTPGRPELRVSVDRDKAARAGIPVSQIALAVRASVEGDDGGKLRQGKDEIPIRVRLGQLDRADAEDIMRMTIQTPKGALALGDLATATRGEGPT